MLVEMELREILRGQSVTAIVLGEKSGENRQFPVYIGPYEAEALERAVHGIDTPRPLTHDLVLNVVRDMGGTLKRVIVDKLVDEVHGGTFYGKLDVQLRDASSVWIDSRPSDAVVLASKTGVPVFVDEEVLAKVNAQPPDPNDEFPL